MSGLEMPNCRMGTLDALYWITKGGVIPGGRSLSTDCEVAVISATAASTLEPGCKKILMMLIPVIVCDSMCWMPPTAEL